MTAKEYDPQAERVRLLSFFSFSKMPFTKHIWSSKMFQARSQKELIDGLHYGLEVKGVSVVLGHSGVGKSISLRKFRDDLSPQYYQPFYLWNTRTSPIGFLRSLCRLFQIHPLHYIADMFDAASDYLGTLEESTGKYPVLLLDDCDGLSPGVLEHLRLLIASPWSCAARKNSRLFSESTAIRPSGKGLSIAICCGLSLLMTPGRM